MKESLNYVVHHLLFKKVGNYLLSFLKFQISLHISVSSIYMLSMYLCVYLCIYVSEYLSIYLSTYHIRFFIFKVQVSAPKGFLLLRQLSGSYRDEDSSLRCQFKSPAPHYLWLKSLYLTSLIFSYDICKLGQRLSHQLWWGWNEISYAKYTWSFLTHYIFSTFDLLPIW